jgi:hypothetical protein
VSERQHLDAARNVEASATMRGDPGPIREMPGALVRDYTRPHEIRRSAWLRLVEHDGERRVRASAG